MTTDRKAERQTVLLLDDDQNLRNNIRHIGRRNNIAVYSAMTYTQARRMLVMRENIVVALVGIYADRYEETVEALARIEEERPDLCVIALADVKDTKVAMKLMQEERIFRYLQKPIKEADLIRGVRAALKHSEMLKRVEHLNEENKAKKAEAKSGIFNIRSFIRQSA